MVQTFIDMSTAAMYAYHIQCAPELLALFKNEHKIINKIVTNSIQIFCLQNTSFKIIGTLAFNN